MTSPSFIVSPVFTLTSVTSPEIWDTIWCLESPPSSTPGSPLITTGIVPKTPQMTAAAMRTSSAMRASHPLGLVTRMSRSSSSGDSVLSMASWRNRDFCITPRSSSDALLGAGYPTQSTTILYYRKDPLQEKEQYQTFAEVYCLPVPGRY